MKAERILREELAARPELRLHDGFVIGRLDDARAALIEADRQLYSVGWYAGSFLQHLLRNAKVAMVGLADAFSMIRGICDRFRFMPICASTLGSKISTVMDLRQKTIKEAEKRLKRLDDQLFIYNRTALIRDNIRLAVYDLNRAFELCTAMLMGRRCAFFEDEWRKEIPEDIDVSFAALLNDVAYTIHRVAEWLATARYEKIHDKPPVYAWEPSPTLREAILTWAKAVKAGRQLRLYSDQDFEMLTAYVRGDYAWLRVGSAVNHATHVKRVDNEYKATYYDMDPSVNETLARLWQEHGIPSTVQEDRVEATIPADKLKDFFVILALATSMDIRGRGLEELPQQIYKQEKQNLESIKELLAQI
jgi:hypothetical protein